MFRANVYHIQISPVCVYQKWLFEEKKRKIIMRMRMLMTRPHLTHGEPRIIRSIFLKTLKKTKTKRISTYFFSWKTMTSFLIEILYSVYSVTGSMVWVSMVVPAILYSLSFHLSFQSQDYVLLSLYLELYM